jgi:hypothetical protein
MPILIQRVVLGDTPIASVMGIGSRNSSGTLTVLPQYEHFISAALPCDESDEPQEGQLNVLASDTFTLSRRRYGLLSMNLKILMLCARMEAAFRLNPGFLTSRKVNISFLSLMPISESDWKSAPPI